MHFRTRDDMDYALRKLDGSDFRNPFEKSRISVSVASFPPPLYGPFLRQTLDAE